MDPAHQHWKKKDPGFQNQVAEEASPRLLLGAQEQQLVLLWNMGLYLPALEKGSRLSKQKAWGKFSSSPTWSTGTTTGLAVKHGTLLASSGKRIQAFKTKKPEESSPRLLLAAHDQQLGEEQDKLPCGSTGNLFWQLSRDRNLHGSYMSNTTSNSLCKPSFRAPWKVSETL